MGTPAIVVAGTGTVHTLSMSADEARRHLIYSSGSAITYDYSIPRLLEIVEREASTLASHAGCGSVTPQEFAEMRRLWQAVGIHLDKIEEELT